MKSLHYSHSTHMGISVHDQTTIHNNVVYTLADYACFDWLWIQSSHSFWIIEYLHIPVKQPTINGIGHIRWN